MGERGAALRVHGPAPSPYSSDQVGEGSGNPTGFDFDWLAEAISPEQLAKAIGAEPAGGGSFHCPNGESHANGDRNPSLSISARNGRTVVFCHGCGLSGSPVQVAGRLWGLSPSEAAERLVRKAGLPGEGHVTKNPRILDTYDYVDQDGDLLFQVVRFEPKGFRQRRRNGTGEWIWNLGDTKRVLYRLPEVEEGVALEKTIFVVEGEKDVHALRDLGAVATCNPGGAGKWRDEYSEVLRGARVRIIADQDEVGRRHAWEVYGSLRELADDVEVLRPRSGKDASDHIAARFGLEDFLPLGGVDHEGSELPMPVRLSDVTDDQPPSFLIKDLLIEGLNLFASDGGVGKTSVALHLAGCVITGEPAFGNLDLSVHKRGPVLYISEEDDIGVVLNRVQALTFGHRWSVERVLDQFHTFALSGASLDSKEWREHILERVQALEVRFVVFDPYGELTDADENSNHENKGNIRFFREITARTGATVLLNHHLGKSVEGKRKLDRIRGASALNAAARNIFLLEVAREGIRLECLKASRSLRPPAFFVEREVNCDPENEASWISARLSFSSPEYRADEEARRFVKALLKEHGSLNTTEIKELSKGSNVPRVDVSKAIKTLGDQNQIVFDKGQRNEKRWRLATLPDNAGQGRQARLPSLPDLARQGE